MTEKEDILTDLESRIAEHSDEPMVTRDWRKRANLADLPTTVFIVERNDEVVGRSLRDGYPVNDRHGVISTVTVLRATNGETAPAELASFQDELRKLIYADHSRRIGNYGASIKELAASQVVFPPAGNNTIAQEIVWQATYKEQMARLFE